MRGRRMTMATRSLALSGTRSALDLGDVGRPAAQAAVGLTIGSATALAAFFAVGEPWGTLNDTLSIGLAWATVPIAVDLVRRHPESPLLGLGVVADLIGVAATTVFTALLIARRCWASRAGRVSSRPLPASRPAVWAVRWRPSGLSRPLSARPGSTRCWVADRRRSGDAAWMIDTRSHPGFGRVGRTRRDASLWSGSWRSSPGERGLTASLSFVPVPSGLAGD